MFYKVPKALFTEEKYKPVSTDAKMLYGLLLDRMHLSAKNGLDGQVWACLPVLYCQRGAGKTALRARKDMQIVLGIRAGRPDYPQAAGTGQAEHHLLEKEENNGGFITYERRRND